MFYSRTLSNKIKPITQKSIPNYVFGLLGSNELLEIHGAFNIHHRNNQTTAIHILQPKMGYPLNQWMK